jgi:hypothetical protein
MDAMHFALVAAQETLVISTNLGKYGIGIYRFVGGLAMKRTSLVVCLVSGMLLVGLFASVIGVRNSYVELVGRIGVLLVALLAVRLSYAKKESDAGKKGKPPKP